jgi:malate dehydrogenase (oxaloacetate-decarboxylating)
MKLAAAHAIAGIITERELLPEYIVPSVFDKRVADAVARDVEDAAYRTGVARRKRSSTHPH